MLRSLSIENFRAFRQFKMAGLGRINLCVGTNNCGKTSILEAISILVANGHTDELPRALARRDEYWTDNTRSRTRQSEFEIRHIFYGHELAENAFFRVNASNDFHSQQLIARVVSSIGADAGGKQRDRGTTFYRATTRTHRTH